MAKKERKKLTIWDKVSDKYRYVTNHNCSYTLVSNKNSERLTSCSNCTQLLEVRHGDISRYMYKLNLNTKLISTHMYML